MIRAMIPPYSSFLTLYAYSASDSPIVRGTLLSHRAEIRPARFFRLSEHYFPEADYAKNRREGEIKEPHYRLTFPS